MNKGEIATHLPNEGQSQPHRMRLPGFILNKEIGLGDVIKRATATVGIQPCDSCAQRATTLNRWLVFTGKQMK